VSDSPPGGYYFNRRCQETAAAEADREAWIDGIRRRLGLVTAEHAAELAGFRAGARARDASSPARKPRRSSARKPARSSGTGSPPVPETDGV
jgi:hypothetical protein